ncbi:MAG: hypothetical protein KAI75_02375 [Desulfobulbaceae bacterium]|nr:hypothetical protein [Desulfobulbaceae bacterium]
MITKHTAENRTLLLKTSQTKPSIMTAFLVLVLLGMSSICMAAVTGQCGNCHTMHNSQNGSSMKLDATPNTPGSSECTVCHAETRATLMRFDCLGCHAQNPNGGSNIISNTPQIAHNNGTDLAAGNYRHVFIDDTYGHNVHGFGNAVIAQDSNLGNTPPGFVSDYDPSTGKYQSAYPVTAPGITCAGRNGCHGDREEINQMTAMASTHHADDTVLRFGSIDEASQGATVGTSYRFLNKLHGAEDSDWEATSSSTDHNEYKGAVYADRTTQSWANVETISQLCSECHGLFHSTTGIVSSSVWIRHPTDVIIPNSGEYVNYTIYNTETPVGRQSIPNSVSGTVTPGSDIVTCLSCHRAHGSPYPDMLRFDYSKMLGNTAAAEAGTGCFRCHSNKDGV